MNLVVIHIGGTQIDELTERLGIPTKFVDSAHH